MSISSSSDDLPSSNTNHNNHYIGQQDSAWEELSSSILSLAEELGKAKPDISYLNFSVKEVNDFFGLPKKWLKADVTGTLLRLFPRFKRREHWEQLGVIGEEFINQLKVKEPTLEEVLFDSKSKTLWVRFQEDLSRVLQVFLIFGLFVSSSFFPFFFLLLLLLFLLSNLHQFSCLVLGLL